MPLEFKQGLDDIGDLIEDRALKNTQSIFEGRNEQTLFINHSLLACHLFQQYELLRIVSCFGQVFGKKLSEFFRLF